MADETYYLSSLESTRFDPVRECRVRRTLPFGTGKVAVEVNMSPELPGQDFNRPDIESVFFAARHEDVSIPPVTEFPCFVFVMIPRCDDVVLEFPIRSDDLDIIGWGELYRGREDAERHVFG